MSGFDKTLLVCSGSCDAVERCLLHAGCNTVKVSDGRAAVSRARQEIFDVAVLVSTGKEMDLAETVLNLRDIRHSMPIIIVAGGAEAGRRNSSKENVANFIPNTRVLNLKDLEAFFDSGPAGSESEPGRSCKTKSRVTE